MRFFFKKKQEERAENVTESVTPYVEADLLRALLCTENITRTQAIEIPSVKACINIISGIISTLPIKLYKESKNGVEEIIGDRRLFLLNHDTGDTLTATQFWRAMIEDYYLGKGGYAYIKKDFTEYRSLNYIENKYIGFMNNTDPIEKDYDILVKGKRYSKYDFLKIVRDTKNGYSSIPIQEENITPLSISYYYMKYEDNLVKKGGNKKGFLESDHVLQENAITALKQAFRKLYANDTESVVVLNKGITFKESSNSCVEMQINENKQTNSEEISMLFGIPNAVIRGNATQKDIDNTIDHCIVPLITDIEASLDRDLLTETEKEQGYYYAFDIKELKRGNIKERYEAYEIAYKNNFLQVDEIREKEDMKPLGFDFIKLGLDSVLYNPNTGEVYTPNTNATTNMQLIKKGGKENNESGTES